MASEYQALSSLPGIENAKVWEPAPATVHLGTRVSLRSAHMKTIDLSTPPCVTSTRRCIPGQTEWRVTPTASTTRWASGAAVSIDIEGHAGYYCAGMNQKASSPCTATSAWACAET
jgi:hypothetical protein